MGLLGSIRPLIYFWKTSSREIYLRSGTAYSAIEEVGESMIFRRGNYPYLVARVRAMKGRLLKRDVYGRLMGMGLKDIIRFIGETDYKKEIDELAGKYSGIDLLEKALNLNLGRTINKLIKISTGDARRKIVAYSSKYEVINVRNIIVGVGRGLPIEEIEKSLVPVEAEPLEMEFDIYGLLKMNLSEIRDELGRHRDYRAVAERKSLVEMEEELIRLYYERLASGFSGRSREDRIVREVVSTEIDARNIMTVLRMKADGATPREIRWRLIENGAIPRKEMELLIREEFDEILKHLKNYPFFQYIKEGIEKRDLSKIEQGLKRYILKKAEKLAYYRPISILPVINYLMRKENEVSNLRLIARGKELNLREDLIRENLVVV